MGFIAELFGYLLNALYTVFNNYGIAIIVFSVILNEALKLLKEVARRVVSEEEPLRMVSKLRIESENKRVLRELEIKE